MKKPVSSPRKKPEKRSEEQEELQDFLLLDLEHKVDRLFHLYREMKRMSTTENEAIAALQVAGNATDVKVSQISTLVDTLILASGDSPTKVAALDAVTAQIVAQQDALQSVVDKANAALNPTVP